MLLVCSRHTWHLENGALLGIIWQLLLASLLLLLLVLLLCTTRLADRQAANRLHGEAEGQVVAVLLQVVGCVELTDHVCRQVQCKQHM